MTVKASHKVAVFYSKCIVKDGKIFLNTTQKNYLKITTDRYREILIKAK